ncbi:ABC transporter ATP-binding protein [Bacillus sp. AK031]
MIEFQKVSKQFESRETVHHVSLSVQKGSVYGLLGSNGAGKTTLLKMLAGIYKPDRGEVFLDGERVFENSAAKQKLFFLADMPCFFPQYTLKQMADFYKNIYPNWNAEKFQQLSDVFNLDPNTKLHKFSKGVQRQAAFWLSLSCNPEVLILDEPIDGLDPVVRKQVKSLLMQEVADRQMTILISSHNIEEIEDLCDHVGILHQGKLLIEKELDELKYGYHKVQIAFRDDPQELLQKLQVVHQEKRGSVISCIVKGDASHIEEEIKTFDPLIFDILPLTLEEIFIYEMEDAGYAVKNILGK